MSPSTSVIGRCSGHAEVGVQSAAQSYDVGEQLQWESCVIVPLDVSDFRFTRLSRDPWNMMYIQGSNIWLQVAIRMPNKTISSLTGSGVTTLIRIYICAGCHTTEVRQECRMIYTVATSLGAPVQSNPIQLFCYKVYFYDACIIELFFDNVMEVFIQVYLLHWGHI